MCTLGKRTNLHRFGAAVLMAAIHGPRKPSDRASLADNVTEFLFVWSPLKIEGGTGTTENPVAIY